MKKSHSRMTLSRPQTSQDSNILASMNRFRKSSKGRRSQLDLFANVNGFGKLTSETRINNFSQKNLLIRPQTGKNALTVNFGNQSRFGSVLGSGKNGAFRPGTAFNSVQTGTNNNNQHGT